MDAILIQIAGRPITTGEVVIFVAALGLGLLLVAVIALVRGGRQRAASEALAQERSRELESHIEELMRTQAEMTGRMQTMAEVFGSRQSDLGKALMERLDGMGHRLGRSMADTTRDTHDNLRKLHERLAIIDRAQHTISDLSGQVTGLQQILANKQSRGAFGQGRMEAIISDALPPASFSFQATLTNGTRPDCLIHLPNDAPALVIDAKFPLEAFNRLKEAETPEATKAAQAQVRRDVGKHIQDISERYFVTGETQDTAFLFVPSEALFADLHEHFSDLMQKAHRSRVVIVSPSLLLLSIQIVQTVLRDVRMREEAHIIQREVVRLVDDVNRLRDRVLNLQKHFGQANRDVEQILISSDKITTRGGKIESMELDDTPADKSGSAAVPFKPVAGSAAE
ncbi:MAG: DNA recombination protein RmuC [Hyphomicrobiales bacterium]|nr:MAG: DNA recombination protein RmuC [Hyphomicrobiales bacterium]